MLFEIEIIPASPDFRGIIHLMVNQDKSLCGIKLTGDIVSENCPIDCPMCDAEIVGDPG